MHAFQFLREPSSEPRPLYALFGEDAYLRSASLDAILKATLGDKADEMAVTRFAGSQATLADVLDEVRTLPFLAPRRVAIVEDADPFVTAHRKGLEGYAERPSESGVLVLSVKSWPSNTKLAKLVEKNGLAVDCKAPKESELPAWLVQLAKGREGVKLDQDAAVLLVELVGPEVGLLASELEKLAIYVGDRKVIRRDDVATMVGAGRVEAVWGVIEAATTGRADEALAGLDRLLTSGEHPVRLVAALCSSLLRVYHAGQARLGRKDLEAACREAGISPYFARKTGQQHGHLGPSRVASLPEWLLRADLDLKGGSQLPPRVVVERLLVRLARERKD
jgi:DNA polymerase-3 subunit delta